MYSESPATKDSRNEWLQIVTALAMKSAEAYGPSSSHSTEKYKKHFVDDDENERIIIQNGRHSAVAVLSTYDDKVILAFKGSSSLHDWVRNAKFRTKPEKNGGRVHRGFQQALDSIWDDIEAHLSRYNGLKIYYAGHSLDSLGGSLATIAAARRPPNILSTFGAPRVGNNFFNQTVDREKWFRVVYSRDPVPWIPPKNFFWLGYEQGGRLIFIDEDGLFHEINEEESTTPEFRFKHTFRPFRGKRNPWEWIDKTIQTGPVIVETGGPELEIPRSAGFSVHFEHLHKRPISDNDFIIPWLKKHVRELPPPYLFELARRILFINPRNAVEYFFLGFIRIQYDALRCKDKSLHHAVLLWLPIAKNVVEFIQQNPNIAGAAGLTALEKEKTFPGDNSPEWVCHHGMNAFVAGMEGKELKDWHISKSEWPKVREECRSQVVGFSEELQDSET